MPPASGNGVYRIARAGQAQHGTQKRNNPALQMTGSSAAESGALRLEAQHLHQLGAFRGELPAAPFGVVLH
jgi:hypothetical protein